jgi:hypothetical protein
MTHRTKSRPYFGLDFQVEVLKTCGVVHSSLGGGIVYSSLTLLAAMAAQVNPGEYSS